MTAKSNEREQDSSANNINVTFISMFELSFNKEIIEGKSDHLVYFILISYKSKNYF